MNASERRALVVEDDLKIAQLLVDYLRADGFAPEHFSDGTQALRAAQNRPFEVVLLDLMLPGMNGIEVCQALRRFSDVPVIMVTARVEEIDRLLGLEMGADDYVCKPFSPRELMARVRANVRRAQGRLTPSRPAMVQGGLTLDDTAQRASLNGSALPLTPLEFRLLRLLMSTPGRVFSRGKLLDALHESFKDVSDRAIDSHIKNLRKKITTVDPQADCINSVYGVGYRFEWPG
jgi:two-component system response regulator BaeR